MRFSRWAAGPLALAVSSVTAAASLAAGGLAAAGPATAAANPPQPVIKLALAQSSITVQSFRGQVFLDPGIWVATLNAPLVFHVERSSYTRPVSITQMISSPSGGTVRRTLPPGVLDGWNGLRDFLTMTVRNSAGKVVHTEKITFCPNTFSPERVTPDGPTAPKYPEQCGGDPFLRAQVWGLQKGWAADPAIFGGSSLRLSPGVYHVTDTIAPRYVRLFGIRSGGATARVKVTVKKGTGCCGGSRPGRPGLPTPLPANPPAPTMNHPPASALPDLTALPSWGITTRNLKSGHTLLDFGATVWTGGHARLDVQGFRSGGSPVMKAYQYFWRDGKLIGRTRAGTMGFDTRPGHNHWHFEQFAQYRLLGKSKKLVLRSHKQGFCIAPTDGVNLLLHGTTWRPSFGVGGFDCGSPSALWVREMLPIGWGDTYEQSVAGQAFDVTSLPNGTYYIEVIANPQKVLHETSTANDVSLRKVILGGTAGHRTVKVPPWHGIDREG